MCNTIGVYEMIIFKKNCPNPQIIRDKINIASKFLRRSRISVSSGRVILGHNKVFVVIKFSFILGYNTINPFRRIS